MIVPFVAGKEACCNDMQVVDQPLMAGVAVHLAYTLCYMHGGVVGVAILCAVLWLRGSFPYLSPLLMFFCLLWW